MAEVQSYLRIVAQASARSHSGQWGEAAGLWEQVVGRNPVNGNHWDRLAEARLGVGDYRGALAAYRKVLELGVWARRETGTVFPAEAAYMIACCHARLGERELAVEALGQAVDRGFRDLERARGDEHLAALRDDARFGELLGPAPADVEGLSRDEGWRSDLRLLAREVKRRAYAPFERIPEREFDAAVDGLSREVPRLSDAQITVGMMKLLRPLGDGHAFVRVSDGNDGFRRALPLQFYWFEEGLFVTAAAPAGSRPNFVGETVPFRLPYSKLEANVSDLYWEGSWPLDHRAWIAPEIYAPPTFDAYRANRDPAMEAVLACREHLPGW